MVTAGIAWPCSIAVDVGGTFTDIVVVDAAGAVDVAKVPSVPTDPSKGVLDSVHRIADDLAIDPTVMLAHCDRFVHGSTVATNAILEDKLATVGLVTTLGFRDSLEIRRGIRQNQWDHRTPWPQVLVPRHLRVGVGGRIDRDGKEIAPLDENAVREAIAIFEEDGVDAVAICLLHSYRNNAHEMQAAELLRALWPDDLTTVSSELVALLGEYERTSTAVVNAGLVPIVGRYLRRLATSLRDLGLKGSFLLIQSNGGTVPLDAVASRPVDLLLSGPAAVGGALRRLNNGDALSLVSMDIGGTSCDVAVMVAGEIPVVDGLEVGGRHINVPSVDVHSVGAGGGTLATVDEAGLLQVGPRGAGADPGPACYGRGGVLPTATDAHLVLGRLRPGSYAGGSVTLDDALAQTALKVHVGDRLDLHSEAAAIGLLVILEQHLRQAVETITIERGRDPRQMSLVAAGGAGGLHGSTVGRALGCERLLIPAEAGVFCAIGMLHSPLRRDVARTLIGSLEQLGTAGVRAALNSEQRRADALVAAEWPSEVARRSTWHIDLRYPGQLWSVRVQVEARTDVDTIRDEFEAEYERLFGHIQPGGQLDVTAVGVTVSGEQAGVPVADVDSSDSPASPSPESHRRCWVDADLGWVEVPVYDGSTLSPGDRLDGPFLIDGRTTTVLGHDDDRLTVRPSGDLEVRLC